jgi:hypothetical protein
MECILHESHVIFNISLCFLELDDEERGLRYLDQAHEAALDSDVNPGIFSFCNQL